VLDCLERADRLGELPPHLCVFNGQVHDCPCSTERVGGPGDDNVVNERLDGIRRRGGETLCGRVVECDLKLLAGLVDSGLRRNADAWMPRWPTA
jgi:hypothetical protein